MSGSGELQGLRVLVTRPAQQAGRLCKAIESRGGTACCLPAIEIRDPLDRARLAAVVDALASYDLAIFISANAVTRGLDYITARGDWPAGVRVAAVGASTAAALAAHGLAADLVPAQVFSSEGLLALDELQDMRGRRVVIFRGNGGRELLHDTLVERGAEVDYAEVYRRACPAVDAQDLLHYWQPGALDVITVTSNETLQNLFEMAGVQGQPLLRKQLLLVVGARQAALAKRLGFTRRPLLAAHASDEAILAALLEYTRTRRAGVQGRP